MILGFFIAAPYKAYCYSNVPSKLEFYLRVSVLLSKNDQKHWFLRLDKNKVNLLSVFIPDRSLASAFSIFFLAQVQCSPRHTLREELLQLHSSEMLLTRPSLILWSISFTLSLMPL